MRETTSGIEGRRQFVARAATFTIMAATGCIFGGGCRAAATSAPAEAPERVGGPCEGCEAYLEAMPASQDWRTRIAPEGEPGEPMRIGGVVYRSDGKTPAAGVVLYVYHTDAAGIYPPAEGLSGYARRHGRLRGWMTTSATGAYEFATIRPASYPNRKFPAHVHAIVKEPDLNAYWIDDYVFDDDPLLTGEERAHLQNRGGSGVIRLEKRDGVWVGRRDLVLGLNVPGYPR